MNKKDFLKKIGFCLIAFIALNCLSGRADFTPVFEDSAEFELKEVSPRVFTPGHSGEKVEFRFSNPEYIEVAVSIYDIEGREIRGSLSRSGVEGDLIVWDGRDGQGKKVPAGIYIYCVETGKKNITGLVGIAK